jgi:hypothetical protein
VKRRVKVQLSEFAVNALEGEDGEGSEHVPARVLRAIFYYLGERDAGRVEWPYPAFMRGAKAGELVELELKVEEKLWSALEEEAASQGVSTQELLEHAALFLAADVNAGRLTERILDGIANGEDDPPEEEQQEVGRR